MAGNRILGQTADHRAFARLLSAVLVIALASSLIMVIGGSALASDSPTVSSVTPETAVNTVNVPLTIVGTGFTPGCRVTFALGANSIESTSVVVTDGTRIDCTIDVTGAPAGNWDVKVINPDGHESSLVGGFAVTADSGSDSLEPNDTIEQASGPLSQGVSYPSYMSKENDVDFFELAVPAGCASLTASLKSIPYGCDIDMSLYNASAQKVGASGNGGDTNEEIEIATPVAGQYYLEVKAWSGYSSDDSYLVSFSLSSPPAVSTISPASGVPGTVVTINGSGFGSAKDGSCVTFGSVQCGSNLYLSWSENKVVVRVPSAVGGVVKIAVTTASGRSNGATFKIVPKISTLSSTRGRAGSDLTITGQGFGAWSSYTRVYFGSVKATTYKTWGSNAIKVRVPNGASGSARVVVTTAGGSSGFKAYSVQR